MKKTILFLLFFSVCELFAQIKNGTYIYKDENLEGIVRIKVLDQSLDFDFQVKNNLINCESKIAGKAISKGKTQNGFRTFVYAQMAGKILIEIDEYGKLRANFADFLDLCFTFKPENEWILQNRQTWIDKFVVLENIDDLISAGYANNISHQELILLFQEAQDEVFLNWKNPESTWKAVGKYSFKNGITIFVVAVLDGDNQGDYTEKRMLYVMNKSGITDKKMIISEAKGENQENGYIICENILESGANCKIKVSQGILNQKTKTDEGTNSTFEIGAEGKLKQIHTKKYKEKIKED
ncbi:MAG: hypothetical protein EAZ97_15745 [Bacteroidetes bacterium]|nr:MAG: hypothetical protein EAZ97_15745 [Bacteroidota bacterium]